MDLVEYEEYQPGREFAELTLCFVTDHEQTFKNGRMEVSNDFLIIFNCEGEKEIEYAFKLDLIIKCHCLLK